MDTQGRHRGTRKLRRPNRRTIQVAVFVPLAVASTSWVAFSLNTPLRTAAGQEWFPDGYTVVAGPDDDASTTEMGVDTEPSTGSDNESGNASGNGSDNNGQQRPPADNAGGAQDSEPRPGQTSGPSPRPTDDPGPSPTDSPTPSPQPPTPTTSPTPSPTTSPTPSPTTSPTPTPSDSPSPTATPTPTGTPTPSPTSTPSPSPTSDPDDDSCLPLPLPLPLPCTDALDSQNAERTSEGLAPAAATTSGIAAPSTVADERGYAITQWLIAYRAALAEQ